MLLTGYPLDLFSFFVDWKHINDPIILNNIDRLPPRIPLRDLEGDNLDLANSQSDDSGNIHEKALSILTRTFTPRGKYSTNPVSTKTVMSIRYCISKLQEIYCYNSIGIFWLLGGFNIKPQLKSEFNDLNIQRHNSALSVQQTIEALMLARPKVNISSFNVYMDQSSPLARDFSEAGASLIEKELALENMLIHYHIAIGNSLLPTPCPTIKPDIILLFLGYMLIKAETIIKDMSDRQLRAVVVLDDKQLGRLYTKFCPGENDIKGDNYSWLKRISPSHNSGYDRYSHEIEILQNSSVYGIMSWPSDFIAAHKETMALRINPPLCPPVIGSETRTSDQRVWENTSVPPVLFRPERHPPGTSPIIGMNRNVNARSAANHSFFSPPAQAAVSTSIGTGAPAQRLWGSNSTSPLPLPAVRNQLIIRPLIGVDNNVNASLAVYNSLFPLPTQAAEGSRTVAIN